MELLVRFDWAIKNILRNKANFDIAEVATNLLAPGVDLALISSATGLCLEQLQQLVQEKSA